MLLAGSPMESFPKKVYAVIVSWNGASWIQGALDSLQQSRYPVRSLVYLMLSGCRASGDGE
jgi:GT2 family glycosyltransferase